MFDLASQGTDAVVCPNEKERKKIILHMKISGKEMHYDEQKYNM